MTFTLQCDNCGGSITVTDIPDTPIGAHIGVIPFFQFIEMHKCKDLVVTR